MQNSTGNYYQLLGVEKTATAEEVKKAYKKLAFDHHPDRNQGNKEAEAKFKQVNEAYQVLSNPDRRKAYDMTGRSPFDMGGADQEVDMSGVEEDLFEYLRSMGHMPGGMGGSVDPGAFFRHRANRPTMANGEVKVTLAEVVTGVTKDAVVDVNIPCQTCLGAAIDSTKPMGTCTRCNGQGMQHISPVPGMKARITCSLCHGKGQAYPTCSSCNGEGYSAVRRTAKVKVPPGIQHNMMMQIPIQEAQGTYAATVLINLDMPAGTKVDGQGNVIQEIGVTYPQLVLGGAQPINLITGEQKSLKIPAGTVVGQGIRVKGEGIPSRPGSTNRGDFVLVVTLKTPHTTPTPEEKELLEKLQDLYDGNKKA